MAAKNAVVTSCFIVISLSQLALGVYLTCLMAIHPGRSLEPTCDHGCLNSLNFFSPDSFDGDPIRRFPNMRL